MIRIRFFCERFYERGDKFSPTKGLNIPFHYHTIALIFNLFIHSTFQLENVMDITDSIETLLSLCKVIDET